jgi:hypothetical protein
MNIQVLSGTCGMASETDMGAHDRKACSRTVVFPFGKPLVIRLPSSGYVRHASSGVLAQLDITNGGKLMNTRCVWLAGRLDLVPDVPCRSGKYTL